MSELSTTESPCAGPAKRLRLDQEVSGDFAIETETLSPVNIYHCNNLTEEDRLFDQVFSNPLILKEILKYLNRNDLLKTSLVNHHWNIFSREVLREKNCLAIIEEENSCRDLRNLNNLLVNSNNCNVPFNGLAVSVPWSDRNHRCILYENLSDLTSQILSKINIKYLALDCEQNSSCVSFDCIQEIVRTRAASLEGLCVEKLPYLIQTFAEYLQLDLEGHWLPNVRVLDFPYEFLEDDVPESIIKELVTVAPKLQKLTGNINTECLDFLLPLKLTRAVKEFVYRPTIASLNAAMTFALESPKLEKFRFSTSEPDDETNLMIYEWREDLPGKVAEIVKLILTSSENSLEKMSLEHFDLILLADQWKVPALKSLKQLRLTYLDRIDNQEGFSTLHRIDWDKYFPNLKQFSVTNQVFEHLETEFYIKDSFRANLAQFTCQTVTKFCLSWTESLVNANQIQMFKTVFPNVKEFYLEHSRQFVSVLNQLWTAWENLEGIYLSVDMRPSCTNYDSVFVGIAKEESVQILQEQFENVNSLEIVPIKPCLLNLRNLKKFLIEFNHEGFQCRGSRSTSESVFLSRLTGDLVFKRMPGLLVEIDQDLCKAKENCHLTLNHLQPFVKFVKHWNFGMSFED